MSQPASYVAPPRSTGTLDRVVTVMLLLVLVVVVPVASFMGLLTSMASDGCSGSTCNSGMIAAGVVTSAAAPVVAGLGALGWVVVRWARDRSTWWVPLVAVVVGAAGWWLGALITFAAVD